MEGECGGCMEGPESPRQNWIRLGGRREREGVGSLTPNISKEVSISSVSMFGAQIHMIIMWCRLFDSSYQNSLKLKNLLLL